MNIVFLDSSSLPSPLDRPAAALSWNDRPATSADEVVASLAGAQVVITNKVKMTRAALEQLPELRIICVAATGYDCIDLAACRRRQRRWCQEGVLPGRLERQLKLAEDSR
jgi:Lactate dehydrogenase and related dehydrogenases